MGILSLKDYNHTINDFKFDYIKTRVCAFDGCRRTLTSVSMTKHKILNNRRYCSFTCLKKQYSSLNYDGSVHLVHQYFGPEHPVSIQITKMRKELAEFRRDTDYLDRIGRGFEHEDENFKKLLKRSEKCL